MDPSRSHALQWGPESSHRPVGIKVCLNERVFYSFNEKNTAVEVLHEDQSFFKEGGLALPKFFFAHLGKIISIENFYSYNLMVLHCICINLNEIINLPKQYLIDFAFRACFKALKCGDSGIQKGKQ